jgi:hypothetical protein
MTKVFDSEKCIYPYSIKTEVCAALKCKFDGSGLKKGIRKYTNLRNLDTSALHVILVNKFRVLEKVCHQSTQHRSSNVAIKLDHKHSTNLSVVNIPL